MNVVEWSRGGKVFPSIFNIICCLQLEKFHFSRVLVSLLWAVWCVLPSARSHSLIRHTITSSPLSPLPLQLTIPPRRRRRTTFQSHRSETVPIFLHLILCVYTFNTNSARSLNMNCVWRYQIAQIVSTVHPRSDRGGEWCDIVENKLSEKWNHVGFCQLNFEPVLAHSE